MLLLYSWTTLQLTNLQFHTTAVISVALPEFISAWIHYNFYLLNFSEEEENEKKKFLINQESQYSNEGTFFKKVIFVP